MNFIINIVLVILKYILLGTVFAAACICYAFAICFIILTIGCIPYAVWPQFLVLPAMVILFIIAGNSFAEVINCIESVSWRKA